MEENLDELAQEEYNTDYEELYKNSTLDELETELYNTQEEYERREQNKEYVEVSGEYVIPGTRKIAELEKMINERKESYEPTEEVEEEPIEEEQVEEETEEESEEE